MKQAVAFLVRNWPLKLAAVILATLLYAGLVLSQNAQVFPGDVPITVRGQQENVVLLSELPSVEQINYFTSGNVGIRPSTSSFEAWIDLSDVDPEAGLTSVDVHVRPLVPGIQVLSYRPTRIEVQLDPYVSKRVPVNVDRGEVPPGLIVREATVTPEEVEVFGPDSVIRRVVEARAIVRIEPTGLSVDREVALVPVDLLGDTQIPVRVEPATVRVVIPVFPNGDHVSVPVTPAITGSPAAGYEIASVRVEPRVVSLEGDAERLAAITGADTEPLSVSGSTATIDRVIRLALPDGVLAMTSDEVRVTVTLRQVTATRTFSAGIQLSGPRGDRTYTLSTDRVLVTLGGPAADLDRLQGQSFTVFADVSGLTPGSHDVRLTASLPNGITLVASSPSTITVVVGLPATPSPPPETPAPESPSPSP